MENYDRDACEAYASECETTSELLDESTKGDSKGDSLLFSLFMWAMVISGVAGVIILIARYLHG